MINCVRCMCLEFIFFLDHKNTALVIKFFEIFFVYFVVFNEKKSFCVEKTCKNSRCAPRVELLFGCVYVDSDFLLFFLPVDLGWYHDNINHRERLML